MIINQIKVEFKRNSLFFLSLSIINLILILLMCFGKLNFINNFLYPIYGMMSWTIIVVYIFVDLFNDFYFGKNKLLLMLPANNSTLILSKYVALLLGILLFWLTSLIHVFFQTDGLYNTAILNSSAQVEGIIYMIVSKIISIIAGLSIIFCSISLSRISRNKVVSYCIAFIVFIGVTTGLVVLVLYNAGCITANVPWSIGINTNVAVYNQYAGLIPVMVIPKQIAPNISTSITWNNTGLNFIVLLILSLVTFIASDFIKHDYSGESI